MICSSCRRIFHSQIGTLRNQIPKPTSSSISSPSIRRRYASTVPATSNAAPTEPSPSTIGAASSNTVKSQPLSTPGTPSKTLPTAAEARKPRKLKSSVVAGQELKGLGYTKAQPVIKAMEDHEYPDWLWTLLDDTAKAGEAAVDLNAMTKKQRARYDTQQERLRKNIPVKIPVHEQSKDLTGPGDDAITSLQRRQEVTKSARVANRKNIRETNFLKSM
ncbi:hypothetical protein LTR84_011144 [Exophiala bonariae]|uniref:Large ribosomal subunit protein mL54 n=1 Tax=Exophiala bonariae TaxID=1690606 RepID=A0AAV9NIE0_9EURO|nr:hypothetical protein LTR84_011144 [Exophiala bonariae]